MVFFMVFIACSKAENIDTMRGKLMWHGIRALELRVLWSNPETGYTSTASNCFALFVLADSPENKMV